MEKSFKQSMLWLHTYSGLILGWLLFAVFVTGTTSYYRNEINTWMKPELQYSKQSINSINIAKQKALELQNKSELFVDLPNSRSNYISIKWFEKEKTSKRPKRVMKYYDASTGEEIHTRQTKGGDFLYRFHFELYSMPRYIGRWIVGIATMSMLVAIITGIIIHTRIFKDIFTFRNKANTRGWMDAHILPAVAALPFHIMITYSGLLLFIRLMMPWGITAVYDKDFNSFLKDFTKLKQTYIQKPSKDISHDVLSKKNLDLILEKANKIWPNNIGSFVINNEKKLIVEVSPKEKDSIFSLRFDRSYAIYDGKTTNLIYQSKTPAGDSITSKTFASMETLHRARFADSFMRFILFVCGVTGIVLAGTGLILWVEKRKKKYTKKKSYGFFIVDKLNIGTIAGLFIAIAVYFISNRVIGFDIENRQNLEINSFFIAWLLSYIYAFFRNSKKAWIEQFAIASLLYLFIPIINLSIYKNNILQRDTIYTYFDISFIILSFVFAVGAYFLRKRYKKGEAK
ncbi:hypothetical protein CPU12_09685 [Malaciobacter molluscorum LMG 25693]|uniref:PepSY domain-containing membrane protein n=1 Tax=Malaciobacter molluscorum LMG 25693 TaxID=870501 RepID=A0A2G1DGD2_9BACT|nr:PepSY-associated TM helix domain-containing protein [Malaciobacter molluscorum]AXX91473.1 PepSY domain-containing membrane protein [Malaciobacter molluscorum LMG 25693]PHO17559.1 hypothetical protein CPU12_09685 [Malaciobacter molluscorum LMG 25693]